MKTKFSGPLCSAAESCTLHAIAEINPEGEITSTTFYPDNQVETVMDPEGHVTTTVYDRANRTIGITNAEGEINTTTYFADGFEEPGSARTARLQAAHPGCTHRQCRLVQHYRDT